MPQFALLARLQAKPGKEDAVAELLRSALQLANQEIGTVHWFGLKLGPSSFGIFDTFNDDASRQAHLDGAIAAELMAQADELFAGPPLIEKVEIIAAKSPA